MKGISDLRFRDLRRVGRLREREGSEKGDGNQANAQAGKVSPRESLSFRLCSLLPSQFSSSLFPPKTIVAVIMPHWRSDVKSRKAVIFSQNTRNFYGLHCELRARGISCFCFQQFFTVLRSLAHLCKVQR